MKSVEYKQIRVEASTHELLTEVAKKASIVTGLPISRGSAIKLAAEYYQKALDKKAVTK